MRTATVQAIGGLPPGQSVRAIRRLAGMAASGSSLLILLAAWWVAGRLVLVDPFLLPPLDDVVARLWTDVTSGDLAMNAGLTLYRGIVGFALAAAVGVPLGIAIARGLVLRWFCEPLVSIGFPMPKIAFLPIFMLWFGVYDVSKIVMVAFASVFTIVATSEVAMQGVDKFLLWSARSMGAGRGELFFRIILPAAMPQILTGLQIALPTALITDVAAEMLMGGAGLGGAMLQAGRYADTTGVYAGIIETAAVGLVTVAAMAMLRRHLLRWHPEFNPR